MSTEPKVETEESKWEQERRERLAREVEQHDARIRDVDDVIRHRAALEAGQKEWLSLIERSVKAAEAGNVIAEKALVANERIAKSLEEFLWLIKEDKHR